MGVRKFWYWSLTLLVFLPFARLFQRRAEDRAHVAAWEAFSADLSELFVARAARAAGCVCSCLLVLHQKYARLAKAAVSEFGEFARCLGTPVVAFAVA